MGEGEENRKETMAIRVREFDMERDLAAVEELERRCQVGLSGDQADGDDGGPKRCGRRRRKKKGMSLYVEQIGDPFARVRHSPDYVMLVAEYGEEGGAGEAVGVIKACVRTVSRGKTKTKTKTKQQLAKVACLLGLRVSPSHRRLGIATELVKQAEAWCAARGAAHATMATTASNAASLALFAGAWVRAVPAAGVPRAPGAPAPRASPRRAPRAAAAAAARGRGLRRAALPGRVRPGRPPRAARPQAHPRHVPRRRARGPGPVPPAVLRAAQRLGRHALPPPPRRRRRAAPRVLAAARALDRHAPWLRVPSLPDVFRPFGTYLLYGLRMSGPDGPALLRSLCRHAHNVARNNPACAVVAADLGPDDPAAAAVPHWPSFSCDEDVWCVKKLGGAADGDGNAGDDDDD
ncbi:hypothetical protein ZWY2020_040561 [Hordeum vulgare]|nr:hypothetical protein ZWY2020_040561 [Hordeum vulgare]